MIRTVIIDDEIWVCQLIKNIVDWSALGFEIVEEAYDGEAGLQTILRQRPQLVLTDIRMSGIDGIQLMQRVRESRLDTKFIVISGYDDFVYAQSALKYGAQGYILKPVDRKELTDFLISIRDHLFVNKMEENKKREIEGKLNESIEQLRIQYFQRCLSGAEVSFWDLEKINEKYICSFQPGIFQVVLGITDKGAGEDCGGNVRTVFGPAQKKILEKRCYESLVLKMQDFDAAILNYPEQEKGAIKKEIKEMIIRSGPPGSFESHMTIAIGCIVPELCRIKESYDSAVKGIRARVKLGTGRTIDLSGNEFENVNVSKIFSVEQEKRLAFYMETLDCMSARTLMKEILQNIRDNDALNPELIFEAAQEILDLLYKALGRKGIEIEEAIGKKGGWSRKILQAGSVEQIVSLLHKALTEIKVYHEKNSQNKKQRAVEIVKSYIAKHYKEDVSLKEAADIVYLNPKYLGELFKKETGMYFNEYLVEYRLDLAKEMLLDVRQRVGEVGEQVGYQDAKYFSKLFKKYVGVTPKQYKKMFS